MVFVLSTDHQPLDPCHPARARRLLKTGRAAVYRHYPFTIILRDRKVKDSMVHAHRVKIDPGSKTTGIAVLNETTGRVIWAAELTHRGQQIRDALLARCQHRRFRRYRKTRYRRACFLNRRRPKGWLPPSLESRVANIETWVRRIMRFCPIEAISLELVKFDSQVLQNPEIDGAEYQHGELYGYEVREYLFEKWGRRCAYCGAENVPLEVEHIVPRSRGGSDRVSNLTVACHDCNQEKGSMTVEEYGVFKGKDFNHIVKQAKTPLKDAAAVSSTRWALHHRLQVLGLPVEVGTGGQTKYNRTRLGLPKTHWLDAACVGASTPENLIVQGIKPLTIKAVGHGNRQMCITNKYGFPASHRVRRRSFMGFHTGDMVRAVIPGGKYAGTHVGRITIRQRPWFRLGRVNVHPKHLRVLHRADGYQYT